MHSKRVSGGGSRKKGGKLSDALNSQLGGEDLYGDVGFRGDEDGDIFAPQVDDYVEGGRSDDDFSTVPPKKKQRSETAPKKAVKGKLRARGPLDPTLSSGAYDAVPVSFADAEAAADDIFGLLDENEFEATAGQGIDDEDAYYDWLESSKSSKRRSRATKQRRPANDDETEEGGNAEPSALDHIIPATADDEDILEQLKELRDRQVAVIRGQGDDEVQDDHADASRQAAVEITKAAVECYTALLRVRVKMQPVVSKMVQFPQFYALPSFMKHCRASSDIEEDYNEVKSTLRSVYAHLADVSGRSFIADEQSPAPSHPDGVKGTQYASLANFHAAVIERANETINHWASRVVQTNAAKLKSVNQPLVDQIRAIISAKARLLGRVQRNRLHARIYGHPEHVKSQTASDRATKIAAGDFDEEIYDDGDFVRELVHRSGAAAQKLEASLKESETGVVRSLDASALALRSASSKVGFHKKTKGKAVSYDPRPKLVGFMMRAAYEGAAAEDNSEHYAALLKSLFQ